ncbi:MAG: hypothetical protein R3200_07735 [Xanthomonadales bacterium]|nr:hypothetical protein [Xanthomonadales bacterium]
MNVELGPNPQAEILKPPAESNCQRPDPQGLLDQTASLSTLQRFAHDSLISSRQVSREMAIDLARLAAILETAEISAYRPLWGKIIITAFFEASTRTRTSFESAALRLDGRVISIPDGQLTGVKKGESLEDIGEMFNAYGDLVVVRHGETDALDKLRKNLRVPLINAGNGSGEHPTQALADWYTLMKWRPDLMLEEPQGPPLNLGILGTPGSMRAVKSFLLQALEFKAHINRIILVSDLADPLGQDLLDAMEASDVEYEVTNDIREVLPDLDVIYMNSIAFLGDSYKAMGARYKLNADSNLKSDAVILHPLARLDELDTSLDDTAHNLYWAQAHGAVFIRQALLIAMFNRFGRLPENIPLR